MTKGLGLFFFCLSFNVLFCFYCWKQHFVSLSSEIMGDFDMVLKFWGPVEADYSAHGGMVLTRLVTLRTWLPSVDQKIILLFAVTEDSPHHCLVSENMSSAASFYVLISVYSQKIQKLNSSSPSLLALPRASWQVMQLSLPTEPLCWKNLVSSWRPRETMLRSCNLLPILMPPSTRSPLRTSRWGWCFGCCVVISCLILKPAWFFFFLPADCRGHREGHGGEGWDGRGRAAGPEERNGHGHRWHWRHLQRAWLQLNVITQIFSASWSFKNSAVSLAHFQSIMLE